MKTPIYHIFLKEFLEAKRNKIIIFLIIVPLIQVIIFGYVATTDIKNVETLICDQDNSPFSRTLTNIFINSEYFNVILYTKDPSSIQKNITNNKVRIALYIPHNFSNSIKKGESTSMQIIMDGTNSNMASLTINRAISLINNFSNDIFKKDFIQIKRLIGNIPEINIQERILYNQELKSSYSMLPGVIGLLLMIVTMAVTSISLVREKESGNIEQLIVTPVKPYQIIAGKILPYIFIAIIDIMLITILSLIVFDLTIKGSFTLLITLSLFMIFANLGIGIFISTITSTQRQAILADIFFFFPNMLLSGFLFPIKNMPTILQWITYLVPLKYYMIIIRGIFLKGLTFIELFPPIFSLFIFSVLIFSLSILRFKKKLS